MRFDEQPIERRVGESVEGSDVRFMVAFQRASSRSRPRASEAFDVIETRRRRAFGSPIRELDRQSSLTT